MWWYPEEGKLYKCEVGMRNAECGMRNGECGMWNYVGAAFSREVYGICPDICGAGHCARRYKKRTSRTKRTNIEHRTSNIEC